MTRIAILASGEGTTADAFIRACIAGKVAAEVVLVICNKPAAGIFTRIQQLNAELGLSIKAELINSKLYPLMADEVLEPGGQTLAEESAILEVLAAHHVNLVLLMGYLRRVGPRLVHEYGWRTEYQSPYQARMINTHPGLLPDSVGYWGIHVQEHVIETNLPYTGQILHIVAENYDDGPVIAEHKLAVEPGETAEDLMERVKTIEKAGMPSDIQSFISGRENYVKSREN